MKIVLLGTGGPRPDPKRNATTTLIRLGQENILFDAGRGVVNQLVRAGETGVRVRGDDTCGFDSDVQEVSAERPSEGVKLNDRTG
jgi:hypothetical protein